MNIDKFSLVRILLKCLYIFPIKKNRIFFMSFDGTNYGFDSKAMVEYIDKNEHGKFEMVWGVNDYSNFENTKIEDLKFVKIKSLKGVFYMMTSGSLIYNINPPSYIPFRKKQLLFNTWHGMAYKRVGKYTDFFNKRQINTTNYYLSHSEKYTEWVLRDSFEYENNILKCGVPRNDIFFNEERKIKSKIVREKYGISKDEKILIYAPTFRGSTDFLDSGIDYNRLKKNIEKRFGGKWQIMYRLHPMISKKYNVKYEGMIDVSSHQDMQELLCAADVMISDYSGGMWDFSLSNKPVFVYATDIEAYDKARGFYLPCSKWPFPVSRDNDELENKILNFDEEQYEDAVSKYFSYMGNYEKGNAAATILDIICKKNSL